MRRCHVSLALAAGLATCLGPLHAPPARAVDTTDTRLLSSPAMSEGKIAFVYADDIWVANADGTGARRLTSHPGEEQNPSFSPDGKHDRLHRQL